MTGGKGHTRHGQLWLRDHMGSGDLGRMRLVVDTGRDQCRAKEAGDPLPHLEGPGNCREVQQPARDLGGILLQTRAGDRTGSVLLTALFIRRNPMGTPDGSFAPEKVRCWKGHRARVALELGTLGYSGSLQGQGARHPRSSHPRTLAGGNQPKPGSTAHVENPRAPAQSVLGDVGASDLPRGSTGTLQGKGP